MSLNGKWETIFRAAKEQGLLDGDPNLMRAFFYVGAASVIQVLIDEGVESELPSSRVMAVKFEVMREMMEILDECGLELKV